MLKMCYFKISNIVLYKCEKWFVMIIQIQLIKVYLNDNVVVVIMLLLVGEYIVLLVLDLLDDILVGYKVVL